MDDIRGGVPLVTLASLCRGVWKGEHEDHLAAPDRQRRSRRGFIFNMGIDIERPTLRPSATDGEVAVAVADPNTVTRIYDVRELIAPDNINPSKSNLKAHQVIRKLVTNVDPDSWRQTGFSVGSARFASGYLVVTQTEANQISINRFVDRAIWERRRAWLARRMSAVVISSIALTGLIRSAVLHRRRRRARLMANRKCIGCGYNLRATPE